MPKYDKPQRVEFGEPDEVGVRFHGEPPPNPDPINRPQGMPNPEGVHTYAKGSPLREGPDYGVDDEDEVVPFLIKLSVDRSMLPERTRWILDNVVPTALRSFIRHNLRYRDTDQNLGLQGQFAEIYHITAKLKRQIWDRRNPESVATGEVQEQLESLIGHALLALDLLDKGNKDGNQA